MDIKFLNEIIKTPSPVGYEDNLMKLVVDYTKNKAEDYIYDNFGSVTAEYNTLQQMIITYNEKAETANKELADATEIAFAPIVSTGFVFISAFWFLIKKKFFI